MRFALSKYLSGIALCVLSTLASFGQFYNGSNVEFGKNRVQFRTFDWYYYPSEKFEVYYYQGGQKLAEYTLISAQDNLKEIEAFFDFAMEDKIQIMTYLKQSEFRQSNVGIANDDQFNIGGAARIMGNKMFVYYEGSHEQLEKQIRQNLSRVVFSQMMYGGDWKDVIKSSTLLSVPGWYQEGIIEYSTEKWNNQVDAFMRDIVQNGKFKSLNRYFGEESKLIGHAFWKYIADVYGESVIPNVLYMTRISRNIESGFLFVLGISLDSITKDFITYYASKYYSNQVTSAPPVVNSPGKSNKEIKRISRQLGELAVKQKKKYKYSQFRVSPDKKQIAFVTNELGQYKVWIHDTESGNTKRIVKREYKLDRLVDESFPVLAWHPTSTILTFISEKRGRAFIHNYNTEDKKITTKELFQIDKVVSMDYSDDGKRIIFSGVKEGHTDLYLYQVIGNNQEQLTFDIFDDLQPRFIRNSTAVIFASNRVDDTLRIDVKEALFPVEKDIYIFELENRSNILDRITSTSGVDETFPAEYSHKHYSYLSNETGIRNRYIANIDSAISAIDTTVHYRYFTTSNLLSSFEIDPVDYQLDNESGEYSLVFRHGQKVKVDFGNTKEDQVLSYNAPSSGNNEQQVTSSPGVETFVIVPDTSIKGNIDINNYVFEDERKDYTYEKEAIRLQEITPGSDSSSTDLASTEFKLPKSRTYRLNFATDYILTQVDNSFSNPFYQNFSGPTSITPGVSGLIKLGISDLFEDFKIVGGLRLALDLQNNDYGIMFENLENRLDKKITLMRQSQVALAAFDVFKINTYSFQYQLKYPFTELSSLRGTFIYRNDRIVRMSVDRFSLENPNFNEHNLGFRLEYVFDNTINRGLNLYNGTRYKFWAERYQQPDKFDEATDFNVIGFDIRHYQKIHRDLIAAFRFSGSTAFGAYKLVHYMGGVDNWLFQKIDYSMPISTSQNYSFQTMAAPMRGFHVNSRNGNSFGLINSEIRWPIFKYFLKKPIKNDFMENFQIAFFSDIGTAWTGKDPYSEENTLNNQTITANPVTVSIKNNREPIVYGYGFGLRSRLLGYFVRADWAWGIDDGIILPRVFYLSLNLDF